MNITNDCQHVKTSTDIGDGASRAKEILFEIESDVKKQQASGADFNVESIADIIGKSLNFTSDFQRGMALAFADFIGSSLEGCPPTIISWNPLERVVVK